MQGNCAIQMINHNVYIYILLYKLEIFYTHGCYNLILAIIVNILQTTKLQNKCVLPSATNESIK